MSKGVWVSIFNDILTTLLMVCAQTAAVGDPMVVGLLFFPVSVITQGSLLVSLPKGSLRGPGGWLAKGSAHFLLVFT